MTDTPPHDRLNETIHQRTRLAIMSTLCGVESLEFNELKSLLELTDGNLSAHMTALTNAGYIEIAKSFKGRRPLTTVRMTSPGRKAMKEYVRVLQSILAGAK